MLFHPYVTNANREVWVTRSLKSPKLLALSLAASVRNDRKH